MCDRYMNVGINDMKSYEDLDAFWSVLDAGSRQMKAFRLRVLNLIHVISSWWFTQGSWVMVDMITPSHPTQFSVRNRCFQMFWPSGFRHICSISKMLQTAACFGCWWLWPCRRDKGMDRHVTRNVPLHFLKECHVQIYGWNMLLKDESWRQMIWQPFFFLHWGSLGRLMSIINGVAPRSKSKSLHLLNRTLGVPA